MKRVQESAILKDLEKKMVFLCGPRQVGKTWLAKKICDNFKRPIYLNYDRLEDREIINKENWPKNTDLIVLDEIHKKSDWKNYVKGIFDTRDPILRILVTGSSRLEMFRQVGDSLAGRFFRHRMLPLSLTEIARNGEPGVVDLEKIMARGGFPEPLLASDPIDADRWRMQYIDGLIRTDVLDFDRIHDFRAIQLVLEMLRRRVGSPVSCLSIAQDAQISPVTVKKYIDIFEGLYIIFRVTPFSKNIARSLLKEPKIYFHDTGMVIGDEGARFENLVATSLLKHVYGLVDYKAEPWQLQYIRTKDGDEVDFCLTQNNTAELMIETKVRFKDVPSTLVRYNDKYKIPATLLVKDLKREQDLNGVSVRSAQRFLSELYL